MQSPDGQRTPVTAPLPEQQYPNLPADLVAQYAALTPFPEPSTCWCGQRRHVDGQQTPVAPPLPNQPQHLSSAELAAQWAALLPHPEPLGRQSHRFHASAAPPSVSCDFWCFRVFILTNY
jgi:hypothetical protein